MTSTKAKLRRWRTRFRESTFERDGCMCVKCEKPAVDAHHITSRKEIVNDGYVKENGISLCSGCHILAEIYYHCGRTFWPAGFHPDALYQDINSSREIAIKRAEELK